MTARNLLPLAALLLLTGARAADDVDHSSSPLRPYIERFTADRNSLNHFYEIPMSNDRRERLRRFYREWDARLAALDFDAMNQDGKVDYVLFHNYLAHVLKLLDFREHEEQESAAYVPFASSLVQLEEARRDGHDVDSRAAAATLSDVAEQIGKLQKDLGKKLPQPSAPDYQQTRVKANRAVQEISELRKALRRWYTFYDNYDPVFTWWSSEAYRKADTALDGYSHFLHEKIAGVKPPAAKPNSTPSPEPKTSDEELTATAMQSATPGDTSDIIGSPIGRDQLLENLAFEMIPYTPEELIDVANREFAWCENEMRRASREMGFGDDWKKALEKVKTMYVAPGKQPRLIRDLAREAEDFVDQHQLVTVPPLARETWRMEMMTPQRQLVTPFFTGGETVSVSYPTAEMSYEQKMMTMRGNNIPFSRATLFHELIPGHELQLFMADRYHAYRGEVGGTPFAVEGWALYWELRFWDMRFQKTPADRIGALFWRMHRCARIIFSLSYHLGKMTPDQCVNFLVDRVGHERENAIAEVRRSVAGDYGPLYQAAYLLGGMQLYALRNALVGPSKMTDRAFNDAVLKENMIPVELIRASLTNQKLTREYHTSWKFLASGSIPGVQ